MLDRTFLLLAGSRFTGRCSIVAAYATLLIALPGASSAQQVQWVQSPINGHWYAAVNQNMSWSAGEALAGERAHVAPSLQDTSPGLQARGAQLGHGRLISEGSAFAF